MVVPNAQRIDDVLARKIVLVRNAAVIQAIHKAGADGKVTYYHPNDAARTTNRLVNGLLSIRPMSRNHIAGTVLIELVAQRVYRVIAHRDIITAKQTTTGKLLVFCLVRQRKRRAQFHFLNAGGECLLNILGILGDSFGSFLYARSRNPVPLGIRPLVIARRRSVCVDRHPLISISQQQGVHHAAVKMTIKDAQRLIRLKRHGVVRQRRQHVSLHVVDFVKDE